MRGPDVMQDTLFSVRSLESYVPADHPLRPVRDILNQALKRMDPLFAVMYAPAGRDSIAPEKLLRALVLQVLYGVRSERMLIEQLGYNLLFRWFVGLAMSDDPWDHSTFSKNRDRLIEHDACQVLFEEVLAQARAKGLLSAEHFSVDGTLVRAWASQKSFVPKDGPPPPASGSKCNPEVDFRGQPRTNDTHESRTDPDSRLYRKSKNAEALPYYMGHALMENRNGLVVDQRLTHATGKAEREAALEMLAAQPGATPKTVGADKGYDTADFWNSPGFPDTLIMPNWQQEVCDGNTGKAAVHARIQARGGQTRGAAWTIAVRGGARAWYPAFSVEALDAELRRREI